jgi:hypothetical protein
MPKILLVEDNEMNRDMLSRRLLRNGFTVAIAVDGLQGVAMATSEKPDQGRPGDARDPGDRAHRQCAGRGPREGDGRRLRRLRYQAGRVAAPAGEDSREIAGRRLICDAGNQPHTRHRRGADRRHTGQHNPCSTSARPPVRGCGRTAGATISSTLHWLTQPQCTMHPPSAALGALQD